MAKEACPYLPEVEGVLGVEVVACLRGRYDAEFYEACLRYAQSLWLEGKPAQAMLQLNRAFTADFSGEESVLQDWPLPYAAMVWVMTKAEEGEFLGNPVRHFQHLATRMSGPRAELRKWRAWACFCLAEGVLEHGDFPRDEKQIEKEGVEIPSLKEVLRQLEAWGLTGEAVLIQDLLGR